MSEQPLNSMIDLREHEIVREPPPENETPRQFVLRVTGRDIPTLAFNRCDFTWQEVKDAGAMPLIERFVQLASLSPRILLREKNSAYQGERT